MSRGFTGAVVALIAAIFVVSPVLAQAPGPPYTLTVTPPTGGAVQGAGINCGAGGATCSVTMPAAMTIGLSAVPSAGYAFVGWTGDCSGTTAGFWLSLNGPRTCSANFRSEGTTAASPAITWPAPAPITEGTALGTVQLNATTTVAGGFVYTPALGTVLPAGNHTLSVTFTPADTTAYTTASKTVTLVVNAVAGSLELRNARLDVASGNLTVEGAFAGVTPTATLNGAPVAVIARTDSSLTLAAPPLVAGTYRLVVTDASGTQLQDSFEWTFGAVGPQGEKGEAGAAGATGTPGPMGLPGPKGDVGAPGPVGATGAQGPEGPAGATGPQGPIGLTGALGPAGPQGVPGDMGPQGVAGPQGPIGLTGAKGDVGAPGPVGATGAQGPEGPAGATGPQGPIGLTGAKGDVGAPGPAGAQGVPGEMGPQGVAGSQGPIGLTGPKGDVGAPGPVGATGAQGPEGLAGATGPQGPSGVTGSKGDVGAPGPVGATGAQGPEGPAGPQGVPGDMGPQGLIGLTGPVGPGGPQGDTGPQGLMGLTGPKGDTGAPGPVGVTGAQGPEGPAGATGPQGPIGLTGATGPGAVRVEDALGQDLGPLFSGGLALQDGDTVVSIPVSAAGPIQSTEPTIYLYFVTTDCTGQGYINTGYTEPWIRSAKVRGNGAVYPSGEAVTIAARSYKWFPVSSDLLNPAGVGCPAPNPSPYSVTGYAAIVLDVSALQPPLFLRVR